MTSKPGKRPKYIIANQKPYAKDGRSSGAKNVSRRFALPCHWCSLPVAVMYHREFGSYVVCAGCGAQGPKRDKPWDAVKMWNEIGIENYVRNFHEAFGHNIGTTQECPPAGDIAMRLTLIEEEYNELVAAIGEGDLANVAKESADLVYVVLGTCISYGLPFTQVFKEVHRSNMSKLDENGEPVYREDGKVIKSNRYKPADVAAALNWWAERQEDVEIWGEED